MSYDAHCKPLTAVLHRRHLVRRLGVDTIRRHADVPLRRRILRSDSYWTGAVTSLNLPVPANMPADVEVVMCRSQLISGSAVPIFQIVIPSYSQKWFDLKGRTTATMIMGVGEHFPPRVRCAVTPVLTGDVGLCQRTL